MKIILDYKYWSRFLIMIVGLICPTVSVKADDFAYVEYRGISETFEKTVYGRVLIDRPFKTDFHLDVEYGCDSEEDEDFVIPVDHIRFNMEFEGYDFFDRIIEFVANNIGAEQQNAIFDIEVSELYQYDDTNNRRDFFAISPNGSYKIEIVKYDVLQMFNPFFFKRNGLTFSSEKFLTPLFRSIKNWYVTDGWDFDFGEEYFMWTFEVLCGKIVKAELLIEYNCEERTIINLLDDTPTIGFQNLENHRIRNYR